MLRLLLIAVAILICGQDESAEARCRVRKCQTMTACSSVCPTAVTASTEMSKAVQVTKTECDGATCKLVTRTVTKSTAQARAERLAQLDPGAGLSAGHHAAIGPINAWEGLGYGSSPGEATTRCCMWGQRSPKDIGTAPGPRGGWYAVVIYH